MKIRNCKLQITLAVMLFIMALPAHASAALTDGLVGYWTFDGKNTNWATNTTSDSSGQGNTGTLVSMSTTTSPTLGKIGQALKFASASNKLSTASNSILDTDTHTISFWIRFDASSTYWGQIMAYRPSGSDRSPGIWAYNGSNCIHWRYDPGNTGPMSCGGPGGENTYFTVGTWYYVTGVKNGGTFTYYVNGVQEGSGSVANPKTAGSASVEMGNTSSYSAGLVTLDDVRIYNRALSATEITQLYKQGAAKLAASPVNSLTSGLVGYWTFDGKNINWVANTTSDSSGQGNTGTLTNMSTTTSPTLGKIGQGLKFDGVDDYVAVTGTPSVQNISYWVKPTAKGYFASLKSGYQSFLNNGLYSGPTSVASTRYINGVAATAESLGSELITDGTAESGNTNSWSLYYTSPALANLLVTTDSPYAGTYAFNLNIANAGSTAGDIQFYDGSYPFSLTTGNLYKVQFAVRGNNSAAVTAIFLKNGSPWTSAGPSYSFDVSAGWVLHTFYFYATRTGTNDNQIDFLLGNRGLGTIFFDNISIKPVNSVGDVTNNAWNFVSVNLDSAVSTNNPSLGLGASYYSGLMDDVRIYNRALSASEVAQLYKLGAAKLAASPVNSLTSGLVGYWTFDGKDTPWTSSTAATTLDKSGNGNTGTLTNMNISTAPSLGKIGQGLKFSGVSGGSAQYINVPNNATLNFTGGVTLSAWIQGQGSWNHDGGIQNTIVAKRDYSGGEKQAYNLIVGTSGFIYFNAADGLVSFSDNTTPLAIGQWYYVTATYDIQNVRLYVNGAEVRSSPQSNAMTTNISPLSIGRTQRVSDTNFGEFKGLIDDVRVYNRALSATEVMQLYKLGQSKAGVSR